MGICSVVVGVWHSCVDCSAGFLMLAVFLALSYVLTRSDLTYLFLHANTVPSYSVWGLLHVCAASI